MGAAKPKKLYWVEMKLSGKASRWRQSAGIRGGKRSTLANARESRAMILRYDPDATVRIYEADVDWREVR